MSDQCNPDNIRPQIVRHNCTFEFAATPLWYAASHAQPATIRILLARGADPNVANAHGDTPLQRARRHDMSAIERLLRDKGAHR